MFEKKGEGPDLLPFWFVCMFVPRCLNHIRKQVYSTMSAVYGNSGADGLLS